MFLSAETGGTTFNRLGGMGAVLPGALSDIVGSGAVLGSAGGLAVVVALSGVASGSWVWAVAALLINKAMTKAAVFMIFPPTLKKAPAPPKLLSPMDNNGHTRPDIRAVPGFHRDIYGAPFGSRGGARNVGATASPFGNDCSSEAFVPEQRRP
jgi:hypothetical protein